MITAILVEDITDRPLSERVFIERENIEIELNSSSDSICVKYFLNDKDLAWINLRRSGNKGEVIPIIAWYRVFGWQD